MRYYLIITFIVCFNLSFGQDKPAYKIYSAKGKESSYQKLLKEAQDADIILFGELHDNPICHWLQLELTKDLYEIKKEKLIMGAEMFETDNQILLNEYLKEAISEKSFKNEAKLWPNYEIDYKPLLEFGKDNKIVFIATNIPRRYAAIVYKSGITSLDSLGPDAKRLIATLPIKIDLNLKCYKEMLNMEGIDHSSKNLPYAQAIKDATMAHNILLNWSSNTLFLHFNGAYHSNNFEGIAWYLKESKPALNIFVISSTEQENIELLNEENYNLGNYIICIPETMTKTH